MVSDTDLTGLYPTGEGLVVFSTIEEAVSGVAAVTGDYRRHAAAARNLAEEHPDHRGHPRRRPPLEDASMDYVVSIHALPMISYRDLVPVLTEFRRVLKPGGVLRLALSDFEKGMQAYLRQDEDYFLVPDSDERTLGGKLIVQLLWYGYSVTLFTASFIEDLLRRSGFPRVRHCGYRQTHSRWPDIVSLDNRERESLFVEAQNTA